LRVASPESQVARSECQSLSPAGAAQALMSGLQRNRFLLASFRSALGMPRENRTASYLLGDVPPKFSDVRLAPYCAQHDSGEEVMTVERRMAKRLASSRYVGTHLNELEERQIPRARQSKNGKLKMKRESKDSLPKKARILRFRTRAARQIAVGAYWCRPRVE
jgi:hypothetical protein